MEVQLATFLTPMVAFLSAMASLLLGYILGKKRAREDEVSAMKLAAYADFLRASMRIACARRIGRSADDLDELMQLNDAKARVLLSADTPVAKALAAFWLHGGTLETESEIISFRHLCDEMRRSLGQQSLFLEIELSNVLFQLQPSSYSFAAGRSSTPA